MTIIIHKISRRGAKIIDHAMFPIGQPLEEAAEVRNKYFSAYRQNFGRKLQ